MKPDYNFRQRPEGMNNALAGTPKSALDRGFVRSDIGSAAKSDKARYI